MILSNFFICIWALYVFSFEVSIPDFWQLKRRVVSSLLTIVCVPVQIVRDYHQTPWNVALQAPRSMGLHRQEYWVGSHFLLRGFSDQEIELGSPCLGRQILTSEPPKGSPLILGVACIFWIWALCQMCFCKNFPDCGLPLGFLYCLLKVFWSWYCWFSAKLEKQWLCTPILGDRQGRLACRGPWDRKVGYNWSDWTEMNFQNSKRRNWCCFRSLHWW